jgi:hypothetical protein
MSEGNDILEQIPPPPEGSVFALQKVETISVPHPYVIGPRHVAIASDRFSGRLGEDAIEASERAGYGCQHPRCQLSHKEHESMRTLFVLLDSKPGDLNNVPGLHAYLVSIKERAESLGIQGFAFPHRR